MLILNIIAVVLVIAALRYQGKHMSTLTEAIAALKPVIDEISTDVSTIATGVTKLAADLDTFIANHPDGASAEDLAALSAITDAAKAAATGLEASATAISTIDGKLV